MPADRLLHPKSSQSHKVSLLTDLEFRVWVQYLLSADDFGVMQDTTVQLQADNRHLRNRSAKVLRRCLDALVSCGLLRRFEHQGELFICSHNWQQWQKVEYPRATDMPKPPAALLATCDDSTRILFDKHPGGQRKDRRGTHDLNHSERASQTSPKDEQTLARAQPRETANGLRLTAQAEANGPPLDKAFFTFQQTYPDGRRKGGRMVQDAYITQVALAGGPDVLLKALANHVASEQWADPKLIPGMDTWLNEERWRQTLPGPVAQKRPWGNWRPAEAQ